MKKNSQRKQGSRGKPKRLAPKAPQKPEVPQWAVTPYLYQQLILRWFETLHAGMKELYESNERVNETMKRIEAKMSED